MATRTLTVTMGLPRPLLSINARRRMHWSSERVHVQAQRELAKYTAYAQHQHPLSAPPYFAGRVRVDIAVRPGKGQKRCDDGAVWEAAKVWLDGLEDANIVGDDRQFRLGSLTWAAERAGELVLTLTEEE